MSWFSELVGADKVVDGITSIATEWIETDMESAEAKALMVKTLDPNGLMRRDISTKVSNLYIFYVVLTSLLITLSSFGVLTEDSDTAISRITELFVPITSLFGIIVTASFGVNYANTKTDK